MLVKALKVIAEELREELLVDVEVFFQNVYEAVLKEVKFELSLDEFRKAVEKELSERNWDVKSFRSKKNEPITNVVKKVLTQFARAQEQKISNDALSRILNAVRKQYSQSGILRAGAYPPVAFRERSEWGLPSDLGDSDSCFREEGCNEGNVDWLIEEYKKYESAFFVVFEYNQGSKRGVGRCWVYTLRNDENKVIGIFATNFYSKGVELKDECFKYVIVRLLRQLFEIGEKVRFATGKRASIPIYLNGDGAVIYDPSSFQNSECVLIALEEKKTQCLFCHCDVRMKDLIRTDQDIKFKDRFVKGLIMCEECRDKYNHLVWCKDCGRELDRYDAKYIEDYGYVCEQCFIENWFICDNCGEIYCIDQAVRTPDGRLLCDDCAHKVGRKCVVCGEFFYFEDYFKENLEDRVGIQQHEIIYPGGIYSVYICDECAKQIESFWCRQCGGKYRYHEKKFMSFEVLRNMVELRLCPDCYKKRQVETS